LPLSRSTIAKHCSILLALTLSGIKSQALGMTILLRGQAFLA
jgi:hypothetical protein